ncbi:MAG: hypothetical protein CMH49_04020 [Myxococcales bacterium]|nr:hypothetical protein [Myxococcales bacterium]
MLAGEMLAGEMLAGEMLAGEMLAGEMLAGEMLAGEMLAGEMLAGEMIAGEMIAGEMNAGNSSGLLCGDGIIGLGETCDDGNQRDGDGCSAACQVEDNSCTDDPLEPNNDLISSSLQQVAPGQTAQEYVLCLGDIDYYELQGCQGGDLEVLVTFDINLMDIDLRLTDQTGRLIDSSALANEIERINYYYSAEESVFLEVAGYLGNSEGSYTVTTLLTGCTDQPSTQCDVDSDCQAGEQCIDQVCLIPPSDCIIDADCSPTETCVSGQCMMSSNRCDFDFDCQMGEVCEAGQCVISTAPECDFDFECSSNQLCLGGRCIDQVTLDDDRFEENDSRATASTLTPNTYDDLVITSDDDDYFAVEICAGGTLEANISFIHALSDLELKIENEQGIALDSSTNFGNSESVSATNRSTTATDMYIKVYGFLGDSGSYSLTVNVNNCNDMPSDPLGDDSYEDNDVFQEASVLSLGNYSDLTLTSGDDDWYAIEVCEGGTLNVDVLFSHAQGDLNVWLYDSALLYLAGSSSSTDNESMTRTLFSAETLYVKVFSFGDEADYSMNLGVTGCVTDLDGDRLEENNTRETGELLTPNLYGNLTITSGDEDWMLFDVCEGGTVDITVSFDDDLGDLDATLYNPSGGTVRTGASSSDNETLSYSNATAGQYALRIYGWSGATNEYSLEFTISDCAPPPPPPLEPDRLEENDTRETGELLTPQVYNNLTITEDDEDWILFDVCEGGDITVDLTFISADGDLDATLYGPNNGFVSDSDTSDDNEQIIVNDASAGRYALLIKGFLGEQNRYALQFSIENCSGDDPGGSGLSPDRLEDNDTFETAEPLSPGLYSSLNIIGEDQDWISIDVCQGGDLTIDVLFSHSDADIDLRLRTSDDEYIDAATSSDDNEQVSKSNLDAGLVYLQVRSYGSSVEVVYDLRITLTCP